MNRRLRNQGQATVEFAIGLVGIIVLFLGLIQIAKIGHVSIRTYQQARTEADSNARGNLASLAADYIPDWENGPDGLRHTADDQIMTSNQVVSDDSTAVYLQELAGPLSLPILAADPALGIDDYVTPAMSGSLASAADLYLGETDNYVEMDRGLSQLTYEFGGWIRLRDRVLMPGLSLRVPEATDGTP